MHGPRDRAHRRRRVVVRFVVGGDWVDQHERPIAPPLAPLEGLWRWNGYGDVVDGCGLLSVSWNYGLTRVLDATEAGFSMQPFASPDFIRVPCRRTDLSFECEPFPVPGLLPAPAQTFLEFDGSLTEPGAGSMAFRTTGACEGTECAAVETERGITFPCESTALTEGFRIADVELTDLGCEAEATLAGEMTSDQAAITFVNETAAELRLYGISSDGQRYDEYVPVAAGQSYLHWTIARTPWVVADAEDRCLGIYLPAPDHGIVTVQ